MLNLSLSSTGYSLWEIWVAKGTLCCLLYKATCYLKVVCFPTVIHMAQFLWTAFLDDFFFFLSTFTSDSHLYVFAQAWLPQREQMPENEKFLCAVAVFLYACTTTNRESGICVRKAVHKYRSCNLLLSDRAHWLAASLCPCSCGSAEKSNETI